MSKHAQIIPVLLSSRGFAARILLLVLGYVQPREDMDGISPSFKMEVPDDHVILISFKWLFMDNRCNSFVELHVEGDQTEKSKEM